MILKRLSTLSFQKVSKSLKRNFSSSKILQTTAASYIHRIDEDPLKFLTFGQCLKNIANRYPDREAIVSCAENSSITFAEALDKVQYYCHFIDVHKCINLLLFSLHNRVTDWQVDY